MKPLPFSTTKKKLLEMYGSQMADKDIRTGINFIIRENRNLPERLPVTKRKIWPQELRQFVKEFGLPQGYSMPEQWLNNIDVEF